MVERIKKLQTKPASQRQSPSKRSADAREMDSASSAAARLLRSALSFVGHEAASVLLQRPLPLRLELPVAYPIRLGAMTSLLTALSSAA